MLNLRDCLDLADVTESEIAAIARHEHIPPIVALELGHHLLSTPEGTEKLRQFIVDDIDDAKDRNNCRECEAFSRTLAHHLQSHPETRDRGSGSAPRILELLAIGQAGGPLGNPPKATGTTDQTPGDDIQNAKQRHDCCACARLSLALLEALDKDKGT